MKQKKPIIALCLIILLSIGMICFGVALFMSRKDDKYIDTAEEGDISRYEWMKMLCEQSGLTEYENTTPYYKDVEAGSPYFSYIQSAVEWNVISGEDRFEGKGYASGRFVAMTAMKSIGERKLMMYLETEDVIEEDTYLELAMEYGLVDKEKLAEGVSMEECTEILETLQNLSFGEFWRDDYARAAYQDGVIELSSDEVIQSNVDGTEIMVSDHAFDKLETGAIIVYEEKNTGLKYARRISGKASDGRVSLELVELEQALESFTASDIVEVNFEDIVNGYALEENAYSMNQLNDRQAGSKFIDIGLFSGELHNKGFKIEFSTDEKDNEKYLQIKIIDNVTGESQVLPTGKAVKLKGDYRAELDIDKILIGVQGDYKGLKGGLQYVDIALDVHSTFNGEIKAEEEVKLPLLKTPIPIVGGIVGVDLRLYLLLSAEGTISIEAELPMGASVMYERDKGVRYQKHELQINNPKIEANCDAGMYFRFEPIPVVAGNLIKIIDVEADVGATASAKITRWPNSQICAETAISFPVISLSVGKDDDVDTLIDVSKEWEIITADKAPVHINTHFERLPDKTMQFVEKCTYKEGEEAGVKDEDTEQQAEDDSLHTYFTQNSDTKFAFDYPDGWTINMEESESLSRSFREAVVLKNDRDVFLRYWEQNNNERLGGAGHFLEGVEVTKAADSLLEGFIIGKIKCISIVDYPSGEEQAIEDGPEMYAVIPKDAVGTDYYGGAHFADYLSFAYRESTYYFSVEAPQDRKFTEEEEREVIAILSSFREVQ